MILNPKYSYEFNCVLNEGLSDKEQITNFASLISDKDRFLVLVPLIERNRELIEKGLGFEFPEKMDFFVVRAEKFKSFSEPVTIEYSISPHEMFLFLLKEICKQVANVRFPDEVLREQYVNAFVEFVLGQGDFGASDFTKFFDVLHEESRRVYPNYERIVVDFSEKSMLECVESMYE